MRPPAPAIVVDAAILISATLGRTSGALFEASQRVSLLTTDRAIAEARRRMDLGLKQSALLGVLDEVVAMMTVALVESLTPLLPESEAALKNSVPSHNGSTRDAHLLALAWSVDADVWTHDRDFAGTGVATWSTTNLMHALRRAAG